MEWERDKLLSPFTTFGIGGFAKYFLEASSIESLQTALHFCAQENIPYLILGKGSNSLFDDRGFDGMVILNKLDFCHFPKPDQVHVGAGYSFSLLGTQTARRGLAGLEFASGIPASVGGAVYMNAGANGNETARSLLSVDYLDENGEKILLPKEALSFGYRFSSFQQQRGVIVGATFQLMASSEARQKQIAIIQHRKQTQPLKEKSAGCIFRNPDCGHAGALIDRCGLKGRQIGGAKVSDIHANFIINAGNATAQDVQHLIQEVRLCVKEKTSIDLEPEVRCIPWRPGK